MNLWRKRVAAVTAFALSTGLYSSSSIQAASKAEIINLNEQDCYRSRTQEELYDRWEMVRNDGNDIPLYTSYPDASSVDKANPGQFNPEAKAKIADYVNFNRWLAGLDDLTIAPEEDWKTADAAAIICSLHDELTHDPSKIEGMSDSFYQMAYDGASSSNLGFRSCTWLERNFVTVKDAKDEIDSWINDSTNIFAGGPGHRSMTFYRSSYPFAFGATEKYSAFYRSEKTARSRSGRPGQNGELAYAWPAPGPFPEELAFCSCWSVDIDPARIRPEKGADSISVKITDLQSGKHLQTESAGISQEAANYTPQSGYEREWGDVIYFNRPEHPDRPLQVEIRGLVRTDTGKPVTLRYSINPVDAEQPMYRLYNPNSGEHFYTSSVDERDSLAAIGWHDEGIGWFAPELSEVPVYRLYNGNSGDHHYTRDKAERDSLIKAGWSYEGIGWYSDSNQTVPLYRQYNANAKTGNHNYTTDRDENDTLVRLGWQGEGIGWYAVAPGVQ